MRPSHKHQFVAPFTDTDESEQVNEQLFLATGATGCPLAYFCLHPDRGDQMLEFQHGVHGSTAPFKELAMFMHAYSPREVQEVRDLSQWSANGDLELRKLYPEMKYLISCPIRFEGQFLGFLFLLDETRRKLSTKQLQYLRTVVRSLVRLVEQRQLKAQNHRFQERVIEAEELGRLGYWEMELQDNTLFWSRGVYKICGLDPSTFKPNIEAFYELVHPEDRAAILEQQEAITLRERQDMDIEHRMVLPDGRTIWVHERGKLIRDAEGKPRIFRGTVQDITELKRRRKDLEEYMAFMEATLANLPIGVCLYRLDDRKTTFSNDRLYEIIGWPREANPDGYTLMEKLYPDPAIRQKRFEEFQQSLQSPKLQGQEWEAQEITTASGEIKRVNSRYVLLWEQKFILLILSDVTDIFKTKEHLRISNERYRLATLATSDVLWDSDLVNKEHYWGENYTKLFGYQIFDDPAENFQDWEKHVHPEDLGPVLEDLEKTLDSDADIWRAEYRYKHGETGAYLRVKDQGYILRDEHGKAFRMVGAIENYTERYQQEQQLRLFASAIENTSDGILITESAQGNINDGQIITYANASFLKMTGYKKGELQGKNIDILRGPKTDLKKIEKLNEKIAKMQSGSADIINYNKNGEEFWVNISITPVIHEETQKLHYVSIQREISFPKAEELNRKLINRLSKDLSEPLNFKNMVNKLSSSIGRLLGAEVVECWVKDELTEHISLVGFYGRIKRYETFRYQSHQIFSLEQEGIVSRLQKEGKSIAYRNLATDDSILWRKMDAKAMDLNAVFAIPLVSGTEFVGGLLLYYKESSRDFSRIMAKRLQDCDRFIGSEIKRKQFSEQLRDILNSVPDMICMIGPDGLINKVNPAMCNTLGFKEEELENLAIRELFHPADLDASLLDISNAIKGEKNPYFENRVRTKNGTYIWVAWTASSLQNSQQFLVVGKNITENRKHLDTIRESNERFRLVSEASNDALWEWKAAKDQLIWTEGFEKLFGYTPGENYCFEDWEEKLHPEDRERVLSFTDEIFKDPEADTLLMDYRFKKADNSYAHVTDHARLIRDADGKVTSMVGAMQDVTLRKQFEKDLLELNRELKERNEQLESSNTELEHFAYVASHDLQEPLRMISGFLTQLEKKYSNQLDDKGRTYIHYAVDGSKRMRTIIRELLEYSRVGRVQDYKEEVAISEILDEVEVVYRILLQQCDGALIRPKKLPVVFGYRVLIFQLFQNLIDNALKYRKKEVAPRVEILYRDSGNFWEFDIKDNGIGIDPTYFNKIFVIFQRLHQKDEYGGSGMGLTTAKKIVESMGGKISVASKQGEGTTFTFTLPKEVPKSVKEG